MRRRRGSSPSCPKSREASRRGRNGRLIGCWGYFWRPTACSGKPICAVLLRLVPSDVCIYAYGQRGSHGQHIWTFRNMPSSIQAVILSPGADNPGIHRSGSAIGASRVRFAQQEPRSVFRHRRGTRGFATSQVPVWTGKAIQNSTQTAKRCLIHLPTAHRQPIFDVRISRETRGQGTFPHLPHTAPDATYLIDQNSFFSHFGPL